ncbi:MAG: hypothetical protein Q8906_12015, partial [Bacillota bacterium]|nr:hypothetical protein [Bacillota bacterium]
MNRSEKLRNMSICLNIQKQTGIVRNIDNGKVRRMVHLKDYKIKTYEEAKHVISEIGFLPLAPLVPHYPSLDSITSKEAWHSGSEFDPWLWRAQFPVDGAAAYGKF